MDPKWNSNSRGGIPKLTLFIHLYSIEGFPGILPPYIQNVVPGCDTCFKEEDVVGGRCFEEEDVSRVQCHEEKHPMRALGIQRQDFGLISTTGTNVNKNISTLTT